MESFKGREINPRQSVAVYRNLHKDCFSVKQGGLVVAHTQEIHLRDAKTHVGPGREEARRTGNKNVHAWVRGYVTNDPGSVSRKLSYNPYSDIEGFHVDGQVITEATAVSFQYPLVLV